MSSDEYFYRDLTYRNHPSYVQSSVSRNLSLQEVSGKNILDFGCGSGDVALYFAEEMEAASVLAIDIGRRNIEVGNQRSAAAGVPQVVFEQGDLDRYDIGDSRFDIIWSDTMIEYLRRPIDATIEQFSRALRPGGILVLSFLPAEPVNRLVYRCLIPILEGWVPKVFRNVFAYALLPLYGWNSIGVARHKVLKELKEKIAYLFVPYVKLYDSNRVRRALSRHGFEAVYMRERLHSDRLTTPHLELKAVKRSFSHSRHSLLVVDRT